MIEILKIIVSSNSSAREGGCSEKEENFSKSQILGNIGDRDATTYGGYSFGLFEGQFTFNDFFSWRIYCYDYQTGNANRVPITTHNGSLSLANPSVTRLKAPNGKEAVLVTVYIFSKENGEAGQLIYYTVIDQALPTCTDAIEDCMNYLSLCNNQAYRKFCVAPKPIFSEYS